MANTAYLILEDGTVFRGEYFGAEGTVAGELVFTTGMTGYLETLTDPSYYGQIVLQTFPLIGNYGIIPEDFESDGISAVAYIAKHPCPTPSNFRSQGDLDSFLREKGVIGVSGIDTRKLTKIIRERGVMNGKITPHPPTEADLEDARNHRIHSAVTAVSGRANDYMDKDGRLIALIDLGAKKSIAEAFSERGCRVKAFPFNAKAEEILAINPDGIMLSNGPGDPADPANEVVIETLRKLMQSDTPLFGICLGHQLLARAHGYKTVKMKFGHRGGNQPVKDVKTGKVYITSQNHGYEVIASDASFVNVNDGTCEGLDYGRSFSVQFHPEACAGPLDTAFIFDRIFERMNVCR